MNARTEVAIETITPRMADDYLGTMRKNRPVSDRVVLEYGMAIDGGKWVVNGEAIKFDVDGHLIDGQHRLRACSLAGKPFRTYVIRGIEDERAFSTMDTGKTRTHGDIFALAGIVDSNMASGAALMMYYYKHGMLTIKGPRLRQSGRSRAGAIASQLKSVPQPRALVSKEDLVSFAMPYREAIIEALSVARKTGASRFLPLSLGAACYALFSEVSRDEADSFMRDLGDGAGLKSTDAVYHLRERLISNSAANAKLSRWAVMFLALKAWRKRRDGETVRTLKLMDNEELPKVK